MSELKEFKASNVNQKSIYEIAASCSEIFKYNPKNGIKSILNIVKNIGGKVEFQNTDNLEKTLHGSIVVPNEDNFTIYIDETLTTDEKIFTIAHELGHYVIHSEFGNIQGRANRFQKLSLKNRLEDEANWFALSFLIPKYELEKFEEMDIIDIAFYFDVTMYHAEKRIETYSTYNH